MKKISIVVVVSGMLALSCNKSGRTEPVENKDFSASDTLITQIDSVRNAIDSSVKEVDRLIEDL